MNYLDKEGKLRYNQTSRIISRVGADSDFIFSCSRQVGEKGKVKI